MRALCHLQYIWSRAWILSRSSVIHGVPCQQEDYFAKTAVVRAELEEVSKEMDTIQESRKKIRALLGEIGGFPWRLVVFFAVP